MSKALASMLALLFLAGTATVSQADSALEVRPSTISVSATGSVDYVPDIARLTLGVRVESPTAQGASGALNQRANQVIAALRFAGIGNRSIKTTSYNLEFREPPPPAPLPAGNGPARMVESAPAAPPANGNTNVVARLPLPGNYVASETLEVTVAVGNAGKALDAAIAAGANESFGLNYQTSNADAIYRAALVKAVASARAAAKAIADAAHLSIYAVQSISTSGPPAASFGTETMARSMAAAQVLPGTDTISATVFAVYKIR